MKIYKKITKIEPCLSWDKEPIKGMYHVWFRNDTFFHLMKEDELNLAKIIDILLEQKVDSEDIKAIIEATKKWVEYEREEEIY